MKTIKVYNIGELIRKELPGKMVHMLNKVAIVEGNNGVVVFNDEAIGWKKKSIYEEIKIGLADIPEENSYYVIPQYMINASIKELLEAEYEEMSITQFVNRYNYNSRLQNNFKTMLRTFDEIGLDSKEYFELKGGE